MSETRVPCRPSSPDARASGPRGGDLPGAAYRSWAFAPTWATARITAWGASLVRERSDVEERVVGRPVEAPAAAPPVAEVSELPQIQLRRGVSPQEMHDSMRRALRMRTVGQPYHVLVHAQEAAAVDLPAAYATLQQGLVRHAFTGPGAPGIGR